jgi:hypothetical protein
MKTEIADKMNRRQAPIDHIVRADPNIVFRCNLTRKALETGIPQNCGAQAAHQQWNRGEANFDLVFRNPSTIIAVQFRQIPTSGRNDCHIEVPLQRLNQPHHYGFRAAAADALVADCKLETANGAVWASGSLRECDFHGQACC